MADEIQLLACGYSAQCTVRELLESHIGGCRVRATMLAGYIDGQGRPLRQRELCERQRTGSRAMGMLNNQREELFRGRVSLHTSRGAMEPVSSLAFGSFAEASLKNSSTLDPIVAR